MGTLSGQRPTESQVEVGSIAIRDRFRLEAFVGAAHRNS